MATRIHIPRSLLEAVDRKAKALRITRTQLVVRALERELNDDAEWSAGFLARLSEKNPQTVEAVDVLMATIRKARRSAVPRQRRRARTA